MKGNNDDQDSAKKKLKFKVKIHDSGYAFGIGAGYAFGKSRKLCIQQKPQAMPSNAMHFPSPKAASYAIIKDKGRFSISFVT
ncbi:hypothetical protein Tco_1026156 [Tanacetum coccineum]